MKKLFVMLTLAAVTSVVPVFAQGETPERPGRPTNDARQDEHLRRDNPVGTATVLLLGLGAGVLGYKVRKNTKKSNSEK